MKHPRLVLPILLALAGCHKDDPASIAVAKPAEHTVANGKELTAEGISLTFPKDWVTVDLTKGQLDQIRETMSKGPNGQAMARMIDTVGRTGAVKMFAFDPNHSKPGMMNNANLVVTPVGNATLDQALDQSKQQIATIGAQGTTSKETLPSGEFGKLAARMKLPNGTEVATLGYVKIDDGKMAVVTFTYPPDQAKAYEATARTVMQTFRH